MERKCSVCRKPGHTKRTCELEKVYAADEDSGPDQVSCRHDFRYGDDGIHNGDFCRYCGLEESVHETTPTIAREALGRLLGKAEAPVIVGYTEDTRELNAVPGSGFTGRAPEPIYAAPLVGKAEVPLNKFVLAKPNTHCLPGRCVGCCGCSSMCTDTPCGVPSTTMAYSSIGYLASHPPVSEPVATVAPMAETQSAIDAFTSPQAVTEPEAELSVSGQPEAKRDRYGRYIMRDPRSGVLNEKSGFTRATTFAKTMSDSFGLNQWGKRMVVKGLTMRPDLLDLAHGLDVRADREALDKIAEDASTHAGNKVAANQGTAFHKVTERLDAGLIGLKDVPPRQLPEATAYLAEMRLKGLTTRREWIERSTMTDRPGEAVAGTFDRILTERNGQHVIGDVKSGRSIDLGAGEIAIQLWTYAVGVNQFGIYDRNTHTWAPGPKVSEEYAIVMHVPVQRDGGEPAYCKLHRIDLTEIAHAAKAAAWTRRWRKSTKGLLSPYVPTERNWDAEFGSVANGPQAGALWQEARDAGVAGLELQRLVQVARDHLSHVDTAGRLP